MQFSNDLHMVLAAAVFSADRHKSQKRKGERAEPYINHPLQVANILMEVDLYDPILLAAAILHDTVEDTATQLSEIQERFGPQVAIIVAEVSDDKSLPKDERKRLQTENASHKSPYAKLVKMADKIDNLRSLAASPPLDWPRERLLAYIDWALQVCAGLQDAHPALAQLLKEEAEKTRHAVIHRQDMLGR